MTITQNAKPLFDADLGAAFDRWTAAALAADFDLWSQERTWEAREATEFATTYPEQFATWEDALDVEEAAYYGII